MDIFDLNYKIKMQLFNIEMVIFLNFTIIIIIIIDTLLERLKYVELSANNNKSNSLY